MACTYCSNNNGKIEEFIIDNDELTIFINQNYMQVNHHGENYKILTKDINYCPMCGASL